MMRFLANVIRARPAGAASRSSMPDDTVLPNPPTYASSRDADPVPSSRTRAGLVGLLLLANVFFAVVLGLSLWQSHDAALRAADDHASTTSTALANGLGNLVDQLDLVLTATQQVLEHQLRSGRLEPQQVNAYIQHVAPLVNGLGTLRFSDAQGAVVQDNGYPQGSPAVTIEDREYFQALQRHDSGALIASKPLIGRTLKEWVIVFARSYRTPAGTFGGVVYATVRLQQLSQLFSTIALPPRSTVTLIDQDFALLVNHPLQLGQQWLGRRIDQPALIARLSQGETAFSASLVSKFDGIARRYAIRKLDRHPFWVGVGLCEDESLHSWRRQLLTSLVAMLFFSGLTGFGGLLLLRGWRAQALTAKRLLESEAMYRFISEHSQDVIWSLDPKTRRFKFVSPSVARLRGFTAEEVIRQPLTEVMTPESALHVERLIDEAIAQREPGERLVLHRPARIDQPHKKGHIVPTEAAITIVFDDRNEPLEVVGVTRDLTARLAAEQALRQSEESYRRIIENSHDLVSELTLEGHYLYASPNHEAVLGSSPQELLGQKFFDFLLGTDEPRKQSAFSDFLSLGTAPHVLRVRTKQGGDRWLETTTKLYVATSGETRVVAFSRDVTEQRESEAERQRLEEQLRTSQKMEAIGILAGGIAHDFNNLLAIILNYNEFAMMRLVEDDSVREDLLGIRKAAERASELTRQLLAFSRKQLWRPAALDLNQIVTELEKMLARILGEDITFERRLAPDLGQIFADRGQLEQVLMNLVVNARDAMPQGGTLTIETCNIEISAQKPVIDGGVSRGSYVLLRVKDDGHGMDEATQAQIFEPFFTTKERGKGTGLGLATVYGIVKKCGGHVEVESQKGQGCAFSLYFPRDFAQQPTGEPPATSPLPTTRRGTETILLVEDDADLREVLRRHLTGAGYRVLVATDGESALGLSRSHHGPLDLLLTDVIMPQMNGRAVAERLAKERSDLRILFMSGYTDNALAHHGVLDDRIHLLAKPFTAEAMLHKVRHLLDSPWGAIPPLDVNN